MKRDEESIFHFAAKRWLAYEKLNQRYTEMCDAEFHDVFRGLVSALSWVLGNFKDLDWYMGPSSWAYSLNEIRVLVLNQDGKCVLDLLYDHVTNLTHIHATEILAESFGIWGVITDRAKRAERTLNFAEMLLYLAHKGKVTRKGVRREERRRIPELRRMVLRCEPSSRALGARIGGFFAF
ncbi:hypothetical protein OQA88_4362 [Cercophora sp. LCS_1]